MKEFIVCSGHIFKRRKKSIPRSIISHIIDALIPHGLQPEWFIEYNKGEIDPCLSHLLEMMSDAQKKDSFVPEMDANLQNPIVVSSMDEVKGLFKMGFDKEDVMIIIETEIFYAHVCNDFDIGQVKEYCLPKFLALHTKYSNRKIPVIEGVGRSYLPFMCS